jgi:hypothetical protein
MASWGFVIVATEDQNTGVGQEVLDGANFLIKADSDPSSIFYRKLDTREIGSFGHSQGATGAINALMKSGGAIKTVIPIELPAQAGCSSKANCTDTRNLKSGSIFFINGSDDILISPSTQPFFYQGEQSIAAYYDATPSNVAKLKGTLIGPNHNDPQGQPSCASIFLGLLCANGVYGYLGYPTAWMMAELQHDNYAAGAFISGSGEIFSEKKNWENVASNIR